MWFGEAAQILWAQSEVPSDRGFDSPLSLEKVLGQLAGPGKRSHLHCRGQSPWGASLRKVPATATGTGS